MKQFDASEIWRRKIDEEAWQIGGAVVKGTLLEVCSYPKPGLVSSISMGSHKDMNVLTFMIGSATLAPAFYLCAQAGRDHVKEISELLPALRSIGIEFEKRLLEATKGVNTQRGILFAGGMLCGAAGYLSKKSDSMDSDSILSVVAALTCGLVSGELEVLHDTNKEKLTAGEQLYLKYKTKGIRGEVEAGFPSVKKAGLPALLKAIDGGLDLNYCLVHTLISLMTCVEDSTILWRKGPEELQYVQNRAKEILDMGSVFSSEGLQEIYKMDQELIAKNISPGGSADLVAISAAMYLLTKKQFPVKIL